MNPLTTLDEPTKKRFLEKILKVNSCWEWTSRLRSNGYGEFSFKGKKVRAHRFSFTMFKGLIPDGMLIMHSCDNRKCVNPDHLSVGTHKDNSQDCVNKGRFHTNVRGNLLCKNGHDLILPNATYYKSTTGYSTCVKCEKEWQIKYYAKVGKIKRNL